LKKAEELAKSGIGVSSDNDDRFLPYLYYVLAKVNYENKNLIAAEKFIDQFDSRNSKDSNKYLLPRINELKLKLGFENLE